MIGELYEHALAGRARPEIEHADGSRKPLPVDGWLSESPGDKSILDRCEGPTLDIGSGPGRLTVALAERGIPALGIDITPYAVDMARSSGALVMLRDVFDRVPGTGRWTTVLLADGNIGIGGDPAALLRRVAELLAPQGRALVELEPPGSPLRREQVRLCHAGSASAWFPWAYVGTDHITDVAYDAGLGQVDIWTVDGRWFASIGIGCQVCSERTLVTLLPNAYRPARGCPFRPDRWSSSQHERKTPGGRDRPGPVGDGGHDPAARAAQLDPARLRWLPLLIGAWLAFIAAAWLLRKVPRRTSVALILLGGIALQMVAVSAPPRGSNDLYRYIWDGKVQAAGVDPYQYVPTATQLAGLRDEFLFNPSAEYCVSPSYVDRHPAADLTPGCTKINRPTVPTIYPPVAEAYFLAVHYLPSASDSSTPIQATTALVAVLITVLLLFGLGRLGRDIRMAALWSWCPTVVLEAGNSAHVDVIAVGITAAAVLTLATARTTRRTIIGGILLGLAIATKMTPALTVPALLRRRWVTVVIAAGSAFTVVYVPHVIRVGSKVIGFLPGYLQQEGYTKGTRFGIIGLFVTGPLAIVAAALILAAVAFAVLQFSDPDRPWQGALYMTAAALAVATPHYQWYSLLLVMLVALDGRPEWLAFAAGGYLAAYPDIGRYTPPARLNDAIAYGVPLVVVAVGWLIRHELARRAGLGEPLPATAEPVVTSGSRSLTSARTS